MRPRPWPLSWPQSWRKTRKAADDPFGQTVLGVGDGVSRVCALCVCVCFMFFFFVGGVVVGLFALFLFQVLQVVSLFLIKGIKVFLFNKMFLFTN